MLGTAALLVSFAWYGWDPMLTGLSARPLSARLVLRALAFAARPPCRRHDPVLPLVMATQTGPLYLSARRHDATCFTLLSTSRLSPSRVPNPIIGPYPIVLQ